MKVLHLISGGDTGGAKTHIISLIQGLKGHIYTKIICFIDGGFYNDIKELAIPIEVFKQNRRMNLSIIPRLEEEIKLNKYDLIHCHGARANFIGMYLKRRINKPFITTIHSDYELDFEDSFHKKIIFTRLNKIALDKFDYYIAVSDHFKDMLIDRGFKDQEIYTVYNGINLDDEIVFVPKKEFLINHNIEADNKTIVGIMARLDLVKDHETFIRAAANLLKDRKDVEFLIAGEGKDERRLNTMVEDLGIGESVHFLGHINKPYSFFNAIDINVLTSASESFPYVILEGAILKKPIISTKVGGVSVLIKDGHNGYIIDIGDSNALSHRIDFLLDNKSQIRAMGENLFMDVKENFSSEAMAKRHIEIYKEILNKVEERQ